MDDTGWEQLMPRPKAAGRPVSPLTSHQFALTTAAAPAAVWTALTNSDLTRRYLHGLAAHSTWCPGAPLTLRSGRGPEDPPAAGQLTGQVLRAEPPRQLSYLLQSGPHDPALIPNESGCLIRDARSARSAGASLTGTRLRSGRMPSSPTGIAGHRRRAGF
jgi:uncharacterized protein YndB with AHSA1/START domain